MDARSAKRRIGVIVIFLFSVVGCSKGGGDPATPNAKDDVLVIGEVTAIVDQVPADGDAVIEIELEDGGSDRLIFGSLHTYPPPTEEKWNLYDLIRRVEQGDVVRAEGRRSERGLELDSLAILAGRQ